MPTTTVTFRNFDGNTYTRTGQTVHTIVRREFGRSATYIPSDDPRFNYKGDSGKSDPGAIGQVRGPLRPKYSFGRSLLADVVEITESKTESRTHFPLVPSGKSAVTVSELGTISVEKLNAVGGGVSAVHLNRDEALNLFAALAAVLGRTAVGNFVPVWERQ